MRKVIAFQGSPRKKGNTAQLLQSALSGAAQAGAETELIHITDLKMTGCRGCYSCKKKGASYGKCVLKDDMAALYPKIEQADGILFGSPVYMCAMTPELKMVIDRLFPYLTMGLGSIIKKEIKTGLIFTQNQTNPALFDWHLKMTAYMINTIGFGKPEIILSVNTIGYHEADLDKLEGSNIAKIHEDKIKHRNEKWGDDLGKAYNMGRSLAL